MLKFNDALGTPHLKHRSIWVLLWGKKGFRIVSEKGIKTNSWLERDSFEDFVMG